MYYCQFDRHAVVLLHQEQLNENLVHQRGVWCTLKGYRELHKWRTFKQTMMNIMMN